MAEALTGINGAIIKWAREYYNMSPIDAATSLGVDLEKYLEWESSTAFPTYAKLKQIYFTSRVQYSFFQFRQNCQVLKEI